MKNTKKILSAWLVLAFATPMLASANFQWDWDEGWCGMMEQMDWNEWWNDFHRWNFHRWWMRWYFHRWLMKWEFQWKTLEQRISLINSNENLSDEQKSNMISRMQEMDKTFETASDEIKAIHEKMKNNEDISEEERDSMHEFMEKNWFWKKSFNWKRWEWRSFGKSDKEREDMINIIKESIQANPNISDDKKTSILEKISWFFWHFFR